MKGIAIMSRKSEIESRFIEYTDFLNRLIKHPSVLDESFKPFGKDIDAALDEVLEISNELGYTTYKDPEGYYGYADIGTGEDLFGVLCHIDVVSEGDHKEWETPPFVLVEKEGRLYGRGTSDDKGPTLAAMWGLRLLLDEGFELSSRVRFIFGTDEESLWRCLDAYKLKEEIPTQGITPDADFPIVHLERGTLQLILKGDIEDGKIIEGGDSLNAVAAKASTKNREKAMHALDKKDRSYEIVEDNIQVFGKSAHASTPDEGANAIFYLAHALDSVGMASPQERFVSDLYTKLPLDHFEDEASGKITFNVGKAYAEDNKQVITLDIRYPVSFTKGDIIKAVSDFAQAYDMSVSVYSSLDSLYVPQDSHLVQTLLKSYRSVTKDILSQPLKIGGATYARAIPNTVAFGPLFPGETMTAHQANESISIKKIKQAIEIYMNAFENLC